MQLLNSRLRNTILIKLGFLFLSFLYFNPSVEAGIQIPDFSDWTDHGVVLQQSSSGVDRHFAGWSPSAVIKKDGTFFLYYIGTAGPRSTDGKPKARSLCVATSKDGIHFKKYPGNPVITYQPHKNEEEGVWTAAANVDNNGKVVLYYGALWAKNRTTESVDVYVNLAISNDGLHFNDLGTVFKSPKENGNENAPYAVVKGNGGTARATGDWHVWYGRRRVNALASGKTYKDLTKSGNVPISLKNFWTGMEAVSLGDGKIAIFTDSPIKVWLTSLNALDQYQATNVVYNIPFKQNQGLAIWLDLETKTWYLYFRSSGTNNNLSDVDKIRLWTAPVKSTGEGKTDPPSDRTAPTAPTGLRLIQAQ